MGYRQDPRWREAQGRYIEPGRESADANLKARQEAAADMYRIEQEYETLNHHERRRVGE